MRVLRQRKKVCQRGEEWVRGVIGMRWQENESLESHMKFDLVFYLMGSHMISDDI